MKTKLLNLVLTSLALLTMAGYQANAQQLPTTKAADNDEGPFMVLDTEEAWYKSTIPVLTWKGTYLSVGPGEDTSVIIHNKQDPAYFEAEFSNGVTGCGDKHFIVEEYYDGEWHLIEKFYPGTAALGQFKYKRFKMNEHTSLLNFKYVRGANLSWGGIRNLKVYGDTYNDAYVTPEEFFVTDIDTTSAVLNWAGSKYPFDQESTYDLEIRSNKDTIRLSCKNTNKCKISNLNIKQQYYVKMTRTYKGDKSNTVETSFETTKYPNPYLLKDVFETGDHIKSSMNHARIDSLHDGDLITFSFDEPIGAYQFLIHDLLRETAGFTEYKLYDENDKLVFTDGVRTANLEDNLTDNPKFAEKKIKKFSLKFIRRWESWVSLDNYTFWKTEKWPFSNIVVEENDKKEITVAFTQENTSLRSSQSNETQATGKKELHLALFKTDASNVSTELVNRVINPEELQKNICVTGERMEDDVTYTVYLYVTLDEEIYNMVSKEFTRADIATGNEAITPEDTGATIRVIDRQVTITRDRDMTGSMQIVSLSGQVIYSQKLHNTTEVSTTLNAPGNYIVRLILQDGVTSRKIQVE